MQQERYWLTPVLTSFHPHFDEMYLILPINKIYREIDWIVENKHAWRHVKINI